MIDEDKLITKLAMLVSEVNSDYWDYSNYTLGQLKMWFYMFGISNIKSYEIHELEHGDLSNRKKAIIDFIKIKRRWLKWIKKYLNMKCIKINLAACKISIWIWSSYIRRTIIIWFILWWKK